MSWPRDVEVALGRRVALAAVTAVVVGAAAFLTGLSGGRAPGTFGALIGSWLFFAGTAMGAVTYAALFRVIPARWARPMVVLGGRHAAAWPVGLALLAVILAGATAAPWVATPSGWLATPVLVARELGLSGALCLLAVRWFHRADGRPPPLAAAVAFLVVYAVVLSSWAFDFVLGPDPIFGSTIIGPYLFVGAFVGGAGLVTLLALRRGELSEAARRDAAVLAFALTVIWIYLFASQYLTIWYGNLPDETAFALRRIVGGWGLVGLAVLVLTFAAPFLVLLHPAGRGSPRALAVVLAGQLLGLWLNCQLMVLPSLQSEGEQPLGPRALLIALGVGAAFLLAVAPGLRRDAPAGGLEGST
jgi:hypothetical protein